MKVSFTVVWEVLQRLLDGTKKVEYRDDTPFWYVRLTVNDPTDAVYVCGPHIYDALILSRRMIPREEVPERWRHYIKTPMVHAVEVGPLRERSK